jgi:tetratricopeptide (TPR) repeat protein
MKKNIGFTVLLIVVFCAGVAFILLRNRHAVENAQPSESTQKMDVPKMTAPSKENVVPVYQEKVAQLKASVEKNPSNAAHIASLARLLMDGHQTAEAIRYFEQVIVIQPKNDSVLFDLSVCYYNEKKYDKAMETTEKILRFKKDNPKALYNKAMLFATKGNSGEAEKILKHLIDVAPRSDEAVQAKAHFLPAGK